MIYTITLNSDNPQALAFVEFAKTFDFLKVTPKKESASSVIFYLFQKKYLENQKN